MIYPLIITYYLNLFYLKKRKLFTSTFILHFFFLTIVMLGPAIYYELGGTSYSQSFKTKDLIVFEKYGIFVFGCNLLFLYLFSHIKKTPLNHLFTRYTDKNKKLALLYFGFWYTIVCLYLLFYFNNLPLVRLLLTGSLPERLDQTGAIRFFYMFSSFFIVFIPSGYFYIVKFLKSNLDKFLLLLLVVLILTSGGNKGLVTFFVIFALLFSGYKFTLKQIIVTVFAFIGLLSIYSITKGRGLNFKAETLYYLFESPSRRFFVTQGSGFIARISMDRRNLYTGDVHEYQLIKKQTYSYIYDGEGAAPTIFIGDLHVKYGYIVAGFFYVLFLLVVFPLLKGTDNMKDRRLYLWWNLFIIFFLLDMAELSFPSFLRISLALFNFFLILIIPRLTLKTVPS